MAERTISSYVEYTTVPGDTFDSLAFQFYLDEKLSSEIIQANLDYCKTLIFDSAVTLKIPVFENVVTADTLPPWRQ